MTFWTTLILITRLQASGQAKNVFVNKWEPPSLDYQIPNFLFQVSKMVRAICAAKDYNIVASNNNVFFPADSKIFS